MACNCGGGGKVTGAGGAGGGAGAGAGTARMVYAAYRWLGVRWVGYPWPLRVWSRLRGRSLRWPGCGCIWRLKRLRLDPWAMFRPRVDRWTATQGDAIDRSLFSITGDEARRIMEASAVKPKSTPTPPPTSTTPTTTTPTTPATTTAPTAAAGA